MQVHLGNWALPQTAPTLVFHHGTPGWGHPTRPVLAACADRGVRVVGVTRPGYADSSPRPGRDVAAIAADVEAVAHLLSLGRFLVAGASGGGPHALATAALLPDRVVAAASISGAGPYGVDGLDFLAGMGQDNLDEFGAALDGAEALRAYMEADLPQMVGVSAQELAAAMASELPPVDAAQVTGALAEDLTEHFSRGLEHGIAGWFDDDMAFLQPWGFDLAALAAIPVAVWHGGQDMFVPPTHGTWLAENIPGASAHLMPEHGHLSILTGHIGHIIDDLLTHW